MGYTYLNLRFNEEAQKPSENVHNVRFESYSTELMGQGVVGRDTYTRYALLGTDEKGKKVAFYVSKKVLDALKPGQTYAFRLSENQTEGAYTDREQRREFGICKTKPKQVKP